MVDANSLNPYDLSLEEYFNIPLTKSKKGLYFQSTSFHFA